MPGKIAQPVAAGPDDTDFKAAAVWKVHLPSGIDPGTDPILRLHYFGDVARVTLNGKLLIDDFYNGKPFDIGVRRYAPGILNGDLEVAILPLQKNAPIYLAKDAQPGFGDKPDVVSLDQVEIIPRYQVQLNAR
jgi:beta-galactosidase